MVKGKCKEKFEIEFETKHGNFKTKLVWFEHDFLFKPAKKPEYFLQFSEPSFFFIKSFKKRTQFMTSEYFCYGEGDECLQN